MAYARWDPPRSKVYVIGNKGRDEPDTHWECIGCDLVPAVRRPGHDFEEETGSLIPTGEFHWSRGTFYATTPGQMIKHLQLHRVLGDAVPSNALLRLQKEEQERLVIREQEFGETVKKFRRTAEERTANQRVAEGDI